VAARWKAKWTPVHGTERAGGQGDSFLADPKDGTGPRVFIKELRNYQRCDARKRFRREVTAYETLNHAGLPTLVEHNSEQWENRNVPLYLVLECVEGEDLGRWMREHGPMSAEQAVACLTRIIETVDYCHGEDVIHRDIKPGNVMLRDSDPTNPILVDFGLSFTKTPEELGDVTRFNEEVGNRFLRLPEAWANRTPISDVTQLAGIFLYALTGIEPHVLLDQEGNMPHRRREEGAKLMALSLNETQLARLMFLFDHAFETVATTRFQTASDLGAAIAHVLSPVPDSAQLAGIRAQADEIIARKADPDAAASASRLGEFVHAAWHRVADLGDAKGLDTLRQDYAYEPGNVDLALKVITEPKAPPYVEYRFYKRGVTDVVLAVNGQEIWTGTNPEDHALADAIERQALTAFNEHYGEF
jgi:serine/threonine protein kinase